MFAVAITALALAAPAAATPANATPIDPDQKIHCQREQVTGQIIIGPKVCHTVAEWRKMADDARDGATRMQEQGYICPSCQGH